MFPLKDKGEPVVRLASLAAERPFASAAVARSLLGLDAGVNGRRAKRVSESYEPRSL